MNYSVLVVDDSRFICEQMKLLLKDTEFEVVHYCTTAEDSLAMYPELLPDIVTMDIILPGMDGLEASEKLLELYPDIKIVIVSSLAFDETEDKAAQLGIRHFVFKPFEKEELLEALRGTIAN